MNKKILIIVIGAILLSFSGCNDKRSNNSDNFTGSQITDSQDPGGKDTSLTFIKGKLIDDTAVIIEPQYDEHRGECLHTGRHLGSELCLWKSQYVLFGFMYILHIWKRI